MYLPLLLLSLFFSTLYLSTYFFYYFKPFCIWLLSCILEILFVLYNGMESLTLSVWLFKVDLIYFFTLMVLWKFSFLYCGLNHSCFILYYSIIPIFEFTPLYNKYCFSFLLLSSFRVWIMQCNFIDQDKVFMNYVRPYWLIG